jgi:hypothetical protein
MPCGSCGVAREEGRREAASYRREGFEGRATAAGSSLRRREGDGLGAMVQGSEGGALGALSGGVALSAPCLRPAAVRERLYSLRALARPTWLPGSRSGDMAALPHRHRPGQSVDRLESRRRASRSVSPRSPRLPRPTAAAADQRGPQGRTCFPSRSPSIPGDFIRS